MSTPNTGIHVRAGRCAVLAMALTGCMTESAGADGSTPVWQLEKVVTYPNADPKPEYAEIDAGDGSIFYGLPHPTLVQGEFFADFAAPPSVLFTGEEHELTVALTGSVTGNEAAIGAVGAEPIGFQGAGSEPTDPDQAPSAIGLLQGSFGRISCSKFGCTPSEFVDGSLTYTAASIGVSPAEDLRYWIGVGMLNCGNRCLVLYQYRPVTFGEAFECDGKPATLGPHDAVDGEIVGTDGPDVIVGSERDDVIDGAARADTICGLGGIDLISGGQGRDTIFGGAGDDDIRGDGVDPDVGEADTIFGGAGNDTIRGGGGRDTIMGGDGDDEVSGGAQADRIFGNRGADLLASYLACPPEGQEDVDPDPDANDKRSLMKGGLGDDVLCGGPGEDRLWGNNGLDELIGLGGDDVLRTGAGRVRRPDLLVDDRAWGGADKDRLIGGVLNQILIGGSGDDHLEGRGGDDDLFGGEGSDTLDGGPGADTIYGHSPLGQDPPQDTDRCAADAQDTLVDGCEELF